MARFISFYRASQGVIKMDFKWISILGTSGELQLLVCMIGRSAHSMRYYSVAYTDLAEQATNQDWY